MGDDPLYTTDINENIVAVKDYDYDAFGDEYKKMMSIIDTH